MKQSKQCPKCQSLHIGHLPYQPDMGGNGQLTVRTVGQVGEHKWYLADQTYGQLEAYFCGNCGYYETYVISPERFRWESVAGFRWVNGEAPKSGTPYR